jgi:glycosyltransferase involved in cell wall biosynthesis
MATCLRPDLFEMGLAGLLRQTYSPLEIVVLVDGGNGETIQILESCRDPRLRWFQTPAPSGMIRAWNRVCAESRGKYFLFCADDDILLDRAVDRQVALLEANPRVAFCHSDFIFIDDEGNEIDRWVSHEGDFIKPGSEEWPRYAVRTGCCMQTVVLRRSLWDTVGGWDEDSGNPGDNSLYLKLLRYGDVGHVSAITCKYRIRTNTPDSWEKRVRNHQEFFALSSKHLRTPPAEISPLVLKRRLCTRISQATLTLVMEAPDSKSKRSLEQWLRREIWPYSFFGVLSRFACRLGLVRALNLVELLRMNFRFIARNVVRSISSVLRGCSSGQR